MTSMRDRSRTAPTTLGRVRVSALHGSPFVRAAFAWCVLCAAGLLLSGSASAQIVRTDVHVTNGFVNAALVSGNTLYIGGSFYAVGPASGGGVPFDAGTGAPVAAFPKVAGNLRAVVSDGAGGWFIGGNFNAVGGVPRTNLAHILADLSIAPWNPSPNGNVLAMAHEGGTVYVSGFFNSIAVGTRPARTVTMSAMLKSMRIGAQS